MTTKTILIYGLSTILLIGVSAVSDVGEIQTMLQWQSEIVEELKTPYRYPRPVLEPTGKDGDFDSLMVDCPFIYEHEGRYYMTYIGYDGKGYRSGLASSDDLIHWNREGMILDWGIPGSFDAFGAAVTSLLREESIMGVPRLKRYNDRYWLFYNGYPEPGYEQGYGTLGIAWSLDLKKWTKMPKPILNDEGAQPWEQRCLYCPRIVYHDNLFYLFYVAGGLKDCWKGLETNWGSSYKELIGFAVSDDLVHWKRNPNNPIVLPGPKDSWDCVFVGDPYITHYKDKWVIFTFGFDGKNARGGVAFSDDLIHWQKWPEPILDIGPKGSFDAKHAHKSCVFSHNGVVFHYYCCVDENEYRTIGLAMSKPLGGSQ